MAQTKKNPALELLQQTAGNTGTPAAGTTGSTTAPAASGVAAPAAGANSTQQRIDELMTLVGNSRFSYDPNTDPAAKAARKQYAREGELAARDTLAGYAGMTGGLPSTAAVSAAAQARNAYAAKSADEVAQLEQLAYGRHQDQQNQRLTELGLLMDQEQQRYDRERYADELAYARSQDEYQRKYNEAILAAQYGDLSGLKELGIDTSKWAGSGSGGSGAYYRTGNPRDGEQQEQGPEGGLTAAAKNELTILAYDNGGYIPADAWASYAAQYGESALIAEGFKTKPDSGQSAGVPADKAPRLPKGKISAIAHD